MYRRQQATLLLVGVLLLSAPVTAAQDQERENGVLVPLRGERVSESEANGPPQNLTAYALSDTELNVSWFAPGDPPIYYRVSVINPSVDEVTYDTFYILTGLEECKDYTITVSSEYDASGTSSFPDDTIGTTSSAEPPPPKNCQITEITSSSMRLTWDVPETQCEMINYSVSWIYLVLWSGEQGYDNNTTTGTSYPNSGLLPYTNYIYNISASTDVGYGESLSCSAVTLQNGSEPVEVPSHASLLDFTHYDTSLQDFIHDASGESQNNFACVDDCSDPPPPDNLAIIQEIASDEMTLTWDEPATDCTITDYSVTWEWEDNSTGDLTSYNATTVIKKYTMKDLPPDTLVTFKVSSSTDQGYGSVTEDSALTRGCDTT